MCACVRGYVSVSVSVPSASVCESAPRTPNPALWGFRSRVPRTESFPAADFNVLAPAVFAPKVGRLQWVQSAVPRVRAPRHTQLEQSHRGNPDGVSEPRGHPAGLGWLRPASPSSQSALFEIELCSFASVCERGNRCFPFYRDSAQPLSSAWPLSSVQNYLERATWFIRRLQDPGLGASLSLSPKRAFQSANSRCFCSPRFGPPGPVGGMEPASPNFDPEGPGNCRMPRFPEALAGCLHREVERESSPSRHREGAVPSGREGA